MIEIKVIPFEDAIPLLKELWPGKAIHPVDALEGSLVYWPDFFQLKHHHHTVGLFVDGKLVGTSHAYFCQRNRIRVRGTYVQPEYRQPWQMVDQFNQVVTRSLGDLMLCTLMNLIGERHGAYDTNFTTFPRTSALPFYERNGFESDGKVRQYPGNPPYVFASTGGYGYWVKESHPVRVLSP